MSKKIKPHETSTKLIFSTIFLVGKYLGLGWIIITHTIIFTFGGNFLDNMLNLGYLMTLMGLMIGLIIGIIGTVRILKS